MRIVIQRAKEASVSIGGELYSSIDEGLLVFLGITHEDTEKDVIWLVNKLYGLRIFTDQEGQMNNSLENINGELLIISQFTLYGDTKKGRRPSFINAAKPEKAIPLYEFFIEKSKEKNLKVQTGVFGADMQVQLINDGPVTLVIDSPKSM